MNRLSKRTLSFSLTFATTLSAYAQGIGGALGTSRAERGSQALTDASRVLTGYFEPAVTLVYIVAAIVGLIGALRVYNKFSSGDPDTGKVAASWGGAAVFLVIAAYALKIFFIN